MRKLLVCSIFLASISGEAMTQTNNKTNDIYFAFFVRVSVSPLKQSIVITEGPMTLSEGIERSKIIMKEGICVLQTVVPPNANTTGATCYPPSRILQIEVISPIE